MTGQFDPYAELPELYDLEHGAFSDDLDLYMQLATVIGDPILELGCGTGRLLRPLANAGCRVTGVDRSQPMLDRARAMLTSDALRQRVTLFEGDMTDAAVAPGGPFGLVIFSLNGLMHLSMPREQRRALEAAHAALDPRGMLVIDVLNPNAELLATFDGRVVHEGHWERPDRVSIDRFSSRTHVAAEQRIETELWFDVLEQSGALRRVRTGFAMRYLVPSELELLLELTGFVEWKLYGTYDLERYQDGSERLIVTAEVTPS